MNVLRFAAFALVAGIGLASCEKELGPIIIFTPPPVPTADTLVDTSYVAAAPETATQRRVLIEEFTGVTCPNCPAGHQIIKNLITANPGRVSAIGYQVYNLAQTNPVQNETRTDNRTQKATDLGSAVFGNVPYLPCAAIDRVKNQTSLLASANLWTGRVTGRLPVAAPLNITITSRYDSTTQEVVLKVHMAYTSAITTKNRLTIAIAENKIIDAQESTNTVYNEYEHEHVFRDFVTATVGDPILDSVATKTAGRVLDRYFVYKVDAKWKLANCVAIAYVHNAEADNAEILQVAETSLK